MQLQDKESTCKHCKKRIVEYRGAWFSAGDDVRCEWDKPVYHEPTEQPWLRKARAAGRRPPEVNG